MKKYVVIDMGGAQIKYSLASENQTLLESRIIDTPTEDIIENTLHEIIKEYSTTHSISGVGICVSDNISLKNWGNRAENEFSMPILIESAGVCAAVGEKYLGNATKSENFVCLTIGNGLQCGIFINNSLYRGANHRAGRIGQFRCGRGKENGQESNHSLGGFTSLVQSISDEVGYPLNGIELFQLADLGNLNVNRRITVFYEEVALVLHNLICTFGPEKVLIGGGISERRDIVQQLKKHLKQLQSETLDYVEIDTCKLKNTAGRLGVLCLLLEKEVVVKV